MTSPAITKPDSKGDKKSPSHSEAEPRPASRAESQAPPPPPPGPQDHFSWMRIFKLADLMMKQGC